MINTKLRLLVRDASIAAFLCFGLMFSSCGDGDSGEIIITSDNDGWEDPDSVNFDFGA